MNDLIHLLILMIIGEHIDEYSKPIQTVFKLTLIAGLIEKTAELISLLASFAEKLYDKKQA